MTGPEERNPPPSHRAALPQLDGELFLTDGGIETVLVFQMGVELRSFAAFELLADEPGRRTLREYFEPFLTIAGERGTGVVLETPTWRASPRWASELGYDSEQLRTLNREAVALMQELRAAHEDGADRMVISGCIGPQDDGYSPRSWMPADAARDYHALQVETFAASAADMVTALTMTYTDEAIGIARAASETGIPCVISFTVETDGRLPSGIGLGEAIEEVDQTTGGAPAYFQINCAHPTHFEHEIAAGGAWLERIRGLRANASTRSHAELDEAEDLDDGDPHDLGTRYAHLRSAMPWLNVLGGCCGTDARHVRAIRDACAA